MRISEVCKIQLGYTARGRLEPSHENGVKAIQLRDVVSNRQIDPFLLNEFDLSKVPGKYRAGGGDVVFRPRGDRNTASVIDETWDETAVVLLPLLLLRPNRSLITPRYLEWVINQAPAQRHFDKFARGTKLRMIPRSSFDDLMIDLPNLKHQRAIVEVAELASQEQILSALMAEKKRTLLNVTLLAQSKNVRVKVDSRNSDSEGFSQ